MSRSFMVKRKKKEWEVKSWIIKISLFFPTVVFLNSFGLAFVEILLDNFLFRDPLSQPRSAESLNTCRKTCFVHGWVYMKFGNWENELALFTISWEQMKIPENHAINKSANNKSFKHKINSQIPSPLIYISSTVCTFFRNYAKMRNHIFCLT